MSIPLCPYFGNCGGCSLQETEISEQVLRKKNILANAINFNEIRIFSGNGYYYRNRMDFIFSSKGLGLRKKRNWNSIIDVGKCCISNERINLLLKEIRGFFKNCDYFDIEKNTGTFKFAVLRAPECGSSVSFVLNSGSERIGDAVEKIQEFAKSATAENIAVTYVQKESGESVSEDYFMVKGSEMLREKLLGKEFLFPIQGFFQNNTQMAKKMHEYANSLLLAHNTKNAHLLDLYGGVGTFGITNAGLFKSVWIIDNYKKSIEAASLNIKLNGITNARAMAINSNQLKKIELASPLIAIADPPRTGMDLKTIEELKKLMPGAILYVSCNARQMSRDLAKFRQYKIKSAALFDFFPQTPHIESMVELVLE